MATDRTIDADLLADGTVLRLRPNQPAHDGNEGIDACRARRTPAWEDA